MKSASTECVVKHRCTMYVKKKGASAAMRGPLCYVMAGSVERWFQWVKIGVTQTPIGGVTHTPCIGVTHTDF